MEIPDTGNRVCVVDGVLTGDGPLKVGRSLVDSVAEMQVGLEGWGTQDGCVADTGGQTVSVSLLDDLR